MPSVNLHVSAGGQELSAKFKATARSGDYSQAFDHLQGLSLSDALVSCLELADAEGEVFATLASNAVNMERPQFSVKLVKTGSIPRGRYLGIISSLEDESDYDTARTFILGVRANKAPLALRLWGVAVNTAATACFYPEFLLAFRERRARICGLADAHAGLGPHKYAQAALFSLGGRYDYRQADAGTEPGGAATTCILVARAVWHAAGCNVIWKDMSPVCNVQAGLFANLKKGAFGYVPASAYEAGMRPQPGDIFHIQGAPFVTKDKKENDSSHVGLIVEVAGEVWSTVEGGAGDHVTKKNTRTIIQVNSKYGKRAFDKDPVSCGPRPLQGWYSVDKIDTDTWMDGC
jgi:hypothetical protein